MRRISSCGAAVAAAALTLVGLTASARGASPVAFGPAPDCSGWTGLPGGATFYRWTGADLADPNDWNQSLNWSPTGVPGAPNHGDDPSNYLRESTDYACIADATVMIPHGSDFAVGGFSFAGATTVTLQPGTRLFANGQDSSIDQTAKLVLDGATLGGSGTVVDDGTIEMYSTWDDQVDPEVPAAAAQTTRFCQSKCDGIPDASPGETDVSATGSLLIDAPVQHNAAQTKTVRGGINLADRRTIVNTGTITLSKDGYIAADNGTAIVNATGGTIDIANDNGIYQGFLTTGPNPAVLRNHGLVEKTAGNRTSVIGIDFRELSGGQIKVASGTLSINGTTAPVATVRQGSTYATGACVPSRGNTCHTRTVPASGGIGAMTLPSAPGSGNISIDVSQPSPSTVPTEHLTAAASTFSRAKPLGYLLTYGHSIAAGLHKVAVKPAGSSSYKSVPTCPSHSSRVPSGEVACLISRTSDPSLNEVLFRLRGIVPNGRWIIR
jgi:hypothetical protein